METYHNEDIEKVEEQTFYESDYITEPPDDIVAYNELRSCADLYRMYNKGILDIQPDFQRNIVWKGAAQTRFIDSLIKQLPIPSMCFSLDYKTQRWQVIDGLQRMSTIIRFLSDTEWTLSVLEDIDPRISGRRVEEFMDEESDLHIYLTIVENLTIPITVLRCDYSQESHTKYLYTIFHRLNTGGIQLNNQEIRNCIYNGSFNALLKELNKHPKWIHINRMSDKKSYRFIHVEMILRFFAFYDRHEHYNGRLAEFLNHYMSQHRNINENQQAEKRELFIQTIQFIVDNLLEENHQKPGHSRLESLMFGVARNLPHLIHISKEQARLYYETLQQHKALSPETLKHNVTDKEKVEARLKAAERIFAGKEDA